MDKISVIVPVYNGQAHIVDCLTSILNQTYDKLELLIYDDGSADDSYEMIRNFIKGPKATGDIEIRLQTQKNSGVAYTRNRGIQEATGDYIVFVDQDDRLSADFCRHYLKLAKDREADIVVGGYTRMSSDGSNCKTVTLKEGEWSRFIVMAPWAHIYRTSFLRENTIEFLNYTIGEDVYFNMMAYSRTDKVAVTDYNGYIWVNNPVSVSNSRQNRVREDVDPLFLLTKIYENLPEQSSISAAAKEYFFLRYIVWYFFFTVRSSGRQDIAKQYDRAIAWLKEHYPLFYKNHYLRIWNRKGELMSIEIACDMWKMLYWVGLLKSCLLLLARKDEG